MAKVEQKGSVCVGIVSGLALLLFAGALLVATQVGPAEFEAMSGILSRRLQVNTTSTTLMGVALPGANDVWVASAAGFVVGNMVAIDTGLATAEVLRINMLGTPTPAGTNMRFGSLLLQEHLVGATVVVEVESIHQQVVHQLSSGSSGWLRNSDSSSFKSSNSLTSSESESSGTENNVVKMFTESGSASAGGGWVLQMLVFVCFGFIYKQRVVDPMGIMPKQTLQYDSQDDFRYGLCDCMKDFHMCCIVMCCPFVRMAHTNQVADVCGFWETLCCLGISMCCGIGPCCLSVYFRIHIKDHMGIQDHCFNDMIMAWCCLPCITGQQALAVDEVMGFNFKCPCSVERSGMSMGGYGENQALNYS